ncbi:MULTISPECIES: hypothetical protein [Actinosynnema]|uniref:Terminase n=1 Tax=Actinosynnema pretiosum TaxID=42197 RepID=A0A290ZAZ3_9PSEU|nr:hypothetical protein [Actinosynnema pretiosum]ATE56154.1 hypothetical protein CNX65_25130 [Actinosynnema pretiosum]MCP2098604.1 Phage terminase-like protein, large subunit, contains N-terminal HTH domain [Actinosynnema pretiosum]
MGWSGPLFEGHKCSLGYEIAAWIEANCVHGPGDVQGRPVQLDDERLDFLVDVYELDPTTGKRLYDEAVISRMKGWAKSELAAWIVLAEAFAAVRFSHWDESGQPVGRRVRSPLIKILATEEGQAAENTYAVVAYIVHVGRTRGNPVFEGVDYGRDWKTSTRILLPTDDGALADEFADFDEDAGGGKILYCTTGSASKDGGKESFVVADETHLYILRELIAMYETVSRNLAKRGLAEPWLLQTTTMYRRGELSVAETTFREYKERGAELGLYVNHRQASGKFDLADKEHTLRQIRQARGKAHFLDPERIYRKMLRQQDPADAERYFLNRGSVASDTWIDPQHWECGTRLGAQAHPLAPGDEITVGFDGSINDDATVLIGCRLSDGLLFVLGIWAKPDGPRGAHWSVPRGEVNERVAAAFRTYRVRLMYCDPHEWRSDIETWVKLYGGQEQRVRAYETNGDKRAGEALDRLRADLIAGLVPNDGDTTMAEHVGNAYVRRARGMRLIRKETPRSNRKIDALMGGALAYQARADVLTAAPVKQRHISTVYYGFN